MKARIVLAFVVTVHLLSGCASLTSPGRSQQLEADKPYWFDYGAERRGAVLVPTKNGGTLMCSEPVPRVIATLDAEGKGKAQGQAPSPTTAASAAAEAETKFKAGGSALNEEVMVLFLREALYRLCEMSVNLSSVDAEYKKPVLTLYTNVIDAAVNLSGRTGEAQRDQIRAKTLDRYLDILAQMQKASTDATAASSQASGDLKKQLEEIRAELTQSVQEIRADLSKVKSTPEAAQPVSIPAKP